VLPALVTKEGAYELKLNPNRQNFAETRNASDIVLGTK